MCLISGFEVKLATLNWLFMHELLTHCTKQNLNYKRLQVERCTTYGRIKNSTSPYSTTFPSLHVAKASCRRFVLSWASFSGDTGNTASFNSQIGVRVGSNGYVLDNSVDDNATGVSVLDGTGTRVDGNNVSGSTVFGYRIIGAGNLVVRNSATNTGTVTPILRSLGTT